MCLLFYCRLIIESGRNMLVDPYALSWLALHLLLIWSASAIYKIHMYWKTRHIPTLSDGTYMNIIIDALKGRIGYGEFAHSFYKEFRKGGHRYGGFYGVLHPILIVLDPALIKRVLTQDFQHFHDRGMYHNEDFEPFSANLVTSEGARWRKTRSVFSPLFTAGRMRSTFPIFDTSSRELHAQLLDAAGRSQPVDICNACDRLAIDNVGRAFFGLELNCLKNPDKNFMVIGNFLSKCSFFQFMLYSFAGDYPRICKLFGKRFITNETTKFFMEVVKQIFDYRRENQIYRNDFMDLFIEKRGRDDGETDGGKEDKRFTFKEFAAECLGFYLGGYETSAATISFCLIELCINQDIQKRVREEIVNVLRRHNQELSYDALMEMTYMDKVIKGTY